MKRITVLLALLVLAQILVLSCDDSSSVGGVSVIRPDGRLYVLNQADTTIYIYDTKTLTRLDSFSSVVEEPHFIEFSEDGLSYYVISRKPGGAVAKFRTSDNALLDTVTTPVFPTALAIINNVAYLTDFTSASGNLRRYDVAGDSIVFLNNNLTAGIQTHDIRRSNDGKYIVSAGYGSDDIVIYEPALDSFVNISIENGNVTIPISSNNYGPYGVQIDHHNQFAYLACRKGIDQIRIVDLRNKTIVDSILIDVDDTTGSQSSGPTYLDLGLDNNILFVTNFADNSLSVVRISSREVLKKIKFQTPRPFTPKLNAQGTHLYVCCANTRPNDGMIYVIETENYNKVDSFSVGSEPFGINWRPAP